MAGVKISNLPAATVPLTGTELIAVVQGGATKQAAIGGTIPAAQIINTPTGTIAATNVQTAINEIVTDLSASSGSSLVGFLQSGTGAVARTVQAKERDVVSVKDFSGASVTAQLDAALVAAAGNYVLIPADVGAGEPTSWANTDVAFDMRGANALGAGRKIALNFSDANGLNLLTVINDLSGYTLSSAANLNLSRMTGALPNNRTLDGAQLAAYTIGAVTGGGSGYVVSGGEFGGSIESTGGAVGSVWGAHSYANIGASATTTVDEVAGFRILNVINSSAVTPATMYSLIADDVTGNATAKGSAWFKGKVRFDSDILVGVTSATHNTIKKSVGGGYVLTVENSANTSTDLNLHLVGGANTNSASAYPLVVTAGASDVMYIVGNGNLQNANNSYGAISDLKVKENIVDATPKLEKLLQVRVVNFNLKTSPDHKQIGVVAQELEQVFPGMVEESNDFDTVTKTREVPAVFDDAGEQLCPAATEEYTERVENGGTTKSVKYSVFVPMLIKAMQEQQVIIDELRRRIVALEA